MNNSIVVIYKDLPLSFSSTISMKVVLLMEQGKAISVLQELLGYEQYLALEALDPSMEDLNTVMQSYVDQWAALQKVQGR